MAYLPLAKRWSDVKSKLETEGAKNKQYDLDLDGQIDLQKLQYLCLEEYEISHHPITTRSKDELKNWVDHSSNPVVEKGAASSWRDSVVDAPFAMVLGNTIYIWVEGF